MMKDSADVNHQQQFKQVTRNVCHGCVCDVNNADAVVARDRNDYASILSLRRQQQVVCVHCKSRVVSSRRQWHTRWRRLYRSR
jgi:hypothetical protein